MIQKKAPRGLIVIQVAMIVDTAKLLYGSEAVDAQIAEQLRDTLISESGLCTFCEKEPVHPNHRTACQMCAEKNIKEIAIENFELDLDEPGKEKH